MDGKKMWKKTGFGILFVAACFVAMYILMAFHGKVLMVILAAVLLLVTAFLFLNEIFSDKAKKWAPEEEEELPVKEMISGGNDGEFRLKISKYMKEMENSQKELIDVLKNQNTLFQTQIENLEHEIYMLSEKQANQTKSVIKFNKENARQLAISERETLEYVMMELKKAIEDNAGAAGVRIVTEEDSVSEEAIFAAEAPVSEEAIFAVEEPEVPLTFAEEPTAASTVELEEVSDAELFEVSDLPGDDEYVIPDMPAPEEIPDPLEEVVAEPAAVPDFSDDLDLSALFEDIAEGALAEEAAAEPVSVPEVVEEKTEEPAPAADPLAGLGGDPNAMMTPEDIAKLLASMGQ